jgi:signal transduction histidine kinase/DNA-binding response OmpR family regulator
MDLEIADVHPTTQPISLLVLDGGPSERAALRYAIGSSVELLHVEVRDVSAALAALRTTPHQCALLDLRLPGADGLAVLHAARAEQLPTAVIVLAAQVDERRAVQLMQAGAMDYIAKSSFSGERLRQSVVQVLRVRRAEATASRERQRLSRLQHYTTALAAQRTVAEVAESTVAELRTTFEAPRALFAVAGDAHDVITVIRVGGFPDSVVDPWRQIPLDAPLPLAEAMRLGVPLFFQHSQELMRRYPQLEPQRIDGDEALFVLPLLVERRAIGCVALIYDQPRAMSDDDRHELAAFARVCAQALDRAYLFDVAQLERRRAEEANRAKDEFLAVVSHELRTPLNAILGWAKMLNAGSLSLEQTRKATATIERNAVAQAQLIDDLLDVSRIITGQMRIKGEPVDLAAVLEAALDIVRPAADAKGVRLLSDFDPATSLLLGDADRLQQVFWNLLSNAVKFTPLGGRVTVRLRHAEACLVIEVEDSGQGIQADFLPHVFQRFRQQDASTARKTGGLGLGLAIVRHLVELHGGGVDVASEGSGKGSTLSVWLPTNASFGRAPSEPAPVSEQVPSGRAPGTLQPMVGQLRGLRLLVVDDDVDARELLTSVLVRFEAQVTSAASASEALDRLQAEHPDMLISDIGMPIEDGYALMERVRRLPPDHGGRTPAVALTAYAHKADRAKALLAGYDAHAPKPIDPNELVRIVLAIAARNVPDRHPSGGPTAHIA